MIHVSAWMVLDHMLVMEGTGPEPPFHWPHLRKTLNDFKDGRSPPLSKRCPDFDNALCSVLTFFDVSFVPIDLPDIY